MNNNNTNIDEILNECQQNINNALNLIRNDLNSNISQDLAQSKPNENKSELDKIYWDNNTHSGDELDIVIERIYSSKAVISKINDIFTTIQDKYTNDKDFDEVAEKINNSIDNIIEEFTLELYKAGFTKAVKLMSECYNYSYK